MTARTAARVMVQVVQIDARIIKRYFALRIPRIDRRLLAMKACVSQQFSTPNRLKYSYFEGLEPAPPRSIAGPGRQENDSPLRCGARAPTLNSMFSRCSARRDRRYRRRFSAAVHPRES